MNRLLSSPASLKSNREMVARPGLPEPRQPSGPIGSPAYCSDAEFNLPVLIEHPASHPRPPPSQLRSSVSSTLAPMQDLLNLHPWQASRRAQKHCTNAAGMSRLLPSLDLQDSQSLVSSLHAYSAYLDFNCSLPKPKDPTFEFSRNKP